jgi:prevent-host-death family protein
MSTVIELKDLRENVTRYAARAQRGESFVVSRQSKPIFKITPVDPTEEQWEKVIDFRTVKKGGVKLSDLLARL